MGPMRTLVSEIYFQFSSLLPAEVVHMRDIGSVNWDGPSRLEFSSLTFRIP